MELDENTGKTVTVDQEQGGSPKTFTQEQVNEMMKKINDNIRMQNGLKDEIQAAEKRVCELESEYQAVLEKIGVCPTCGKTTTGG